MKEKYLWYTIRKSRSVYSHGWDVHGFYEAPESSVLAGQTLKRFIDAFSTLEAAQAAYPDAQMGSSWTDPGVVTRHLPGEEL